MKHIILGLSILVAGVIIIASFWNDKHFLAPLAILGGGSCILGGIVIILEVI